MRSDSNDGFHDQTIRQIVHPHIDGNKLRIQLSNIFGSRALTFGEVHVSYSVGISSIVLGTNRMVTLNGETSVTIPVGEKLVNDSISLLKDIPLLSIF